MDKVEIENILSSHFPRRDTYKHLPSEEDWKAFEQYFGWKASPTFRAFMEILPMYYFEGGILQVVCKDGLRGEDTIIDAYETEEEIGEWDRNMIPFYDVGNGDFYCITKSKNDYHVYYVYHEDRYKEIVAESIEEWIKKLPDY